MTNVAFAVAAIKFLFKARRWPLAEPRAAAQHAERSNQAA
jgi:hypothetical protein